MSKEEFAEMFANIPLGERRNVIYVDDKWGAMSWYVVKIESDQETEVGIKAREFISKL